MSVNNSTLLSVCLYCKTNSQLESEKEFHEIYDEVGLELQLPTLVETFFHIKLVNEGKQLLCEDCVNRLIELYDLEEHAKEGKVQEEKGNVADGGREEHESDPQISNNDKSEINDITSDKGELDKIEVCEDVPKQESEVVRAKDIEHPICIEKLEVAGFNDAESLSQYDKTNTDGVQQHLENKESEVYGLNDAERVSQYDETNIHEVQQHLENKEIPLITDIERFQYDEDDEDEITYITKHRVEVLSKSEEEDNALAAHEVSYDLTADDTNNEYEDINATNDIDNIPPNDGDSQISNHSLEGLEHYGNQELEEINDIENVQSVEEYNDQQIFNQCEPDSQYDENPELDLENNEHDNDIAYDLSTDEDADSEIQLIENVADENTLEVTEVSSKELQFLENQFNTSVEHSQTNELIILQQTTDTCTDNAYSLEQNDLIEEHIYEDNAEHSLLVHRTQNSHDNTNLDDIGVYEEFENNHDNNQEDFIESQIVDNVVEEVRAFNQDNDTIMQIDDSIDLVLQDTQIKQGDVVVLELLSENTENDENMATEEEYLLEELICSEDFDCVDLNEYFDNNIRTKFEQLELQWSVECKMCLQKYDTLQDLLKHTCIQELFHNGKTGCCILKDCEEITNDLKSLARHLIIHHYKNIESLSIYGRCNDCEKNFSNLIDLNKHSCCRTVRRKAGARNFCQSCNMDFQSLKRYVFHMQFHLTKHRPKICLLCGALFNNSNDFFNHTQYNHEPDTAMACVTCDRFFKDKIVYEKHLELHDESKYAYACLECPKKYTNKAGLNLHMDVYHKRKTKPLHCEYCDKELGSAASYRNHMKSHEPETEVPGFLCSECGLISNSSDIIKDHIEMDKKSSCNMATCTEEIISVGYTCENCSMDFFTRQHLQKHRLSPNHSDKSFYCFLCRRPFKSLQHMRNHASSHKDYEQWENMFPILRFFMCNIGNCQDAYPLWSSLYYHKKRPHKKDNDLLTEFKCQFCQQNCPTKMSLAIHVSRSHNGSVVSCSHCNKKFKNDKLLQEHVDKFHTAIKCSVCDKQFKNLRNLKTHESSVHHSIKRFYCKYCKKGYFYKSEMENHEKNVHPEISYKCDICKFTTNYQNSLVIHLNSHNNKKNFECKICSKSFGRKQQWSLHMKRHEEFVCNDYCVQGCEALFLSYDLLKTHIRKTHENPKEGRKKVNTTKRKRSLQKKASKVTEEEEDATISSLLEDIDDSTAKRPKQNTEMLMKDIDVEKESIDLIEILDEDTLSDHDFIIQCKDD